MKMRSLNHVNLVVADVERSAAFYQRAFGMERMWAEGDFVFLTCGDTDLALVGGRPEYHRRFHIGFRVDSRTEVNNWLAFLDSGFSLDLPAAPEDYGDYYTFTLRDPDGHGIEIYYETEPRGRVGFPAN